MVTKDVFTLPDGTELEKGTPFTLKKWENNTWNPVAKYPANFLQNLSTKELQDLGITKRQVTIAEETTEISVEMDDLFEHLARVRLSKEFDKKIEILDQKISLDTFTRFILLQAYTKAISDPNYILQNFKIRSLKWIDLTATEIIVVMNAINDHSQICAQIEKTIAEEIAAKTITSRNQIETHGLWPATMEY